MALTSELLRANAATAALTDEQINAIAEMSRNDEAAVIGQRVGEIYGGLDADILAASGMAKEGSEKTYDYAKRVIGGMRTQAESAAAKQTEIDALTEEKARLEKVIADGGTDAEARQKLQQAQTDLAAVTKSFTELKTKYDASKAEHAKELFGVRLDAELERASGAIKFKADLPEAVTRVLLGNAKAAVRAMQPEYIDNGQGGKVLAFKGQDGAVMRNPENNLNPYTATELVMRELKTMGVLETGKKTSGAGTTGNEGGDGGASGVIDLSGARTQSEADDMISKALLSQGLATSSPEFHEKKKQAWTENAAFIKTLPIR